MRHLLTFGALLLFSLGFCFSASAQEAATYTEGGAVNASSNHLDGPTLSTSFILGELVVGNMSGESVQVEHGFHYTHFTITPIEEVPTLSMALYPNPSSEQLHLRLEEPLDADVSIQLLDLNGRLVKRQALPAGSTTGELQVSELAAGIYFLKLANAYGTTLSMHKVEKLD